MPSAPFPEIARVDARDKVLGRTLYAADVPQTDPLHAMLVPAAITRGRLVSLDPGVAGRVPGVVRVLTSDDFPVPPEPDPDGPPPPPPTLTAQIAYFGQPVALVVAESLEAAIEGAEALAASATYEAEGFVAVLGADSPREEVEPRRVGDAEAALAAAATRIEDLYEIPVQHHNPIELIATSVRLSEGRLIIDEPQQGVDIARFGVAGALQMDPEAITVRSAYIGGAFGQKGFAQRQTAIVARAAILTGRPVKLVTPRGQLFHLTYHRPASRHQVRLGADAGGRLTGLAYDAVQENTPGGAFAAADYHEGAGRLYGIENYSGTAADVFVDRHAPGYMRGTHPYGACFAIESALDELAIASGRDPVEIRLANDTATDPLTGNPLSARHLNACLREGARRFGWERRTAETASMWAEDGSIIGMGVASGIFPAAVAAGEVTLRVSANGTTRLIASGHEMGQGIRTMLANTILQQLDVDPDGIEIVLGDTDASPQFMTAGQWGTTSIVSATADAAARLAAAYAELAGERTPAGNLNVRLARLRRPYLEVKGRQKGPGQDASALEEFRQRGFPLAGPEYPQFTSMSHIAHFAEVHVEPTTRRVRVARMVSIVDCGRVISPRTARSQVYGGVVWAIGHTLGEGSEIDPRFGGVLNDDLADYVVAVNADIGEIDVGFIDEPDPMISDVGAKGLGELTMVGASAAIANAIRHATGRRIRKLPIRVDDLL
ncbi:MAG: xanthine dehydrogenase family protein molybdopterin-binding subunit [Rhodobacteraceae bacterium]|nr:xanthine dehydrogenase family protein molybdopterin-binding subunit [Paracoccaceae bacterium]